MLIFVTVSLGAGWMGQYTLVRMGLIDAHPDGADRLHHDQRGPHSVASETDTLTPLVTKSSKVGFIMQDKPVLTDPVR